LLFNSFQFLVFYAICLTANCALRGNARKLFLLVASYYFYMCWSTRYILVILGITIVDFLSGLLMESSKSSLSRRVYLGLSLFCNIGLLVVFKYFNFLSISVFSASRLFGATGTPLLLNIILPVGLSFHTFQAMSYIIDLYKKKVPAERSLLNYALYVAYFPQMVAGPIERPSQLLPQFHIDPLPTGERFRSGAAQALWGFFKKMVVADNLAGLVNLVYANPTAYSGPELLLATVCFALQIYCDFSGYTDIALGAARMMGYELRVNFRQPYFSRSIGEFWHRWHISLSTWFRDYVYIPLGGNRVAVPRLYLNLMITFMLSGLWHGASWNFVIWGGLHGSYLAISRLTARLRAKVRGLLRLDRAPGLLAVLQVAATFAMVCVGWVFFRAKTLASALYIVSHAIFPGRFHFDILSDAELTFSMLPFLLAAIAAMVPVEWWIMHPHRIPAVWRYFWIRVCGYQICVYSIVFFGVFGHVDFIYFKF
jgi:alginate O-acetyltransferase complex protein AlgI